MNPWHQVQVNTDAVEESFPTVIEIPKGDKNKYELDKESGLLRLDRVLSGAVYYPANYGFIPCTFAADDDPLDVLVLGLEPVYPLTIIDARAIGVVRMRDEKGADDKIIAVSVNDPAFCEYRDHVQLPRYTVDEIRKFFEEYKTLEKKEVVVDEVQGPGQALDIIREAFALYGRLYREGGRT